MGYPEFQPPPEYTHNDTMEQQSHQVALEELTTRPAAAPEFPQELPDRKVKKDRHWKIATLALAILAILLLGIVIFLSVWIVELKHHISVGTSTMPIPAAADNNTQATVTVTMTNNATATFLNTTTVTQNITWTSIAPITVDKPGTVATTTPPTPTSTADATCTPSGPSFIATNFCAVVDSCTEVTGDTQANECLGLCLKGGLCDVDRATMPPRTDLCCGKCGCFS